MAGLDGDMYVRGGGGPGARGVLNTGQPVVRQLVRSALRHWVSEFRVDGFVLVNAENLAQDPLGAVRDSPPLLEELAADPVLRDAKIIASGNDGGLLPRGGERGVPHYGVLAEWNGRFARDIIALLRDNAGRRGATGWRAVLELRGERQLGFHTCLSCALMQGGCHLPLPTPTEPLCLDPDHPTSVPDCQVVA
jgi:pullulanase/glycogen debranching enzyme